MSKCIKSPFIPDVHKCICGKEFTTQRFLNIHKEHGCKIDVGLPKGMQLEVQRMYRPTSVKPIPLSADQELLVLENILAMWSPQGLRSRYTLEVLSEMRDLFAEAAEL